MCENSWSCGLASEVNINPKYQVGDGWPWFQKSIRWYVSLCFSEWLRGASAQIFGRLVLKTVAHMSIVSLHERAFDQNVLRGNADAAINSHIFINQVSYE